MPDGATGVGGARAAFDALGDAAPAPDLAARRAHLAALRAALRREAEALARAVDADFGGRPRAETMLAEVGVALAAIDWTARRLRRWLRPDRPRLPPEFLGARARVERVPLGRVGIIGPWNYPIQLTLVPLVAALAGGNRVLLKPSEHVPRTSAALAALLGAALPDAVRVVEGGPEVARAVAALPLDGLFFTGSTATGRAVARAAAENLVPLVLELGGKSPAILMPDLGPGPGLDAAARAVMAGKLFSSGQTCIAPDYLLAPRARLAEVAAALARAARALAPDGDALAAIARPQDLSRLLALLEGHDARPLLDPMPVPPRMGPWLVVDPDPDSDLMRQEIFGPILPLVPYDGVAEAESFANARPCPLALYVFGRDRAACEGVVARVRSGGALIGDCLLHVVPPALPFGGAGESGMGAYHGQEGFWAFTRPRTVMAASRWMPARLARPPYGPAVERVIRLILR